MAVPTTPGVTDYATPSETEVVITRVVDAPRELVFDMWTKPEHLPQWMTGPEGWTMPVCEVDLRPGGRWHFVWRKAEGEEMGMGGEYREVVRPERIVNTESWGPEWPETVNTMVLMETNGRTIMTLTIAYPSREARDAALATGMKEGSDISYARLDRYLARLAAV